MEEVSQKNYGDPTPLKSSNKSGEHRVYQCCTGFFFVRTGILICLIFNSFCLVLNTAAPLFQIDEGSIGNKTIACRNNDPTIFTNIIHVHSAMDRGMMDVSRGINELVNLYGNCTENGYGTEYYCSDLGEQSDSTLLHSCTNNNRWIRIHLLG